MEVRGRQLGGAEEAQQRFRQVQAELSNANRARVRRARQVLETLSMRRLVRQRSANRAAAESNRMEGNKEIRGRSKPAVDGAAAGRSASSAKADAAQAQKRAESARAQTTVHVDKNDRLELSKAARAVAGKVDEAHEARVRELKSAHEDRSLNTPERISKAAQRLLGG